MGLTTSMLPARLTRTELEFFGHLKNYSSAYLFDLNYKYNIEYYLKNSNFKEKKEGYLRPLDTNKFN